MFIIKIARVSNPRIQFSVVARHLVTGAAGSVQLTKQFSNELVCEFASTSEFNHFLKNGNEEYIPTKVERPRVFFCRQVVQIWDGTCFWCQATIWPEGDNLTTHKFIGPREDSAETARKSFWFHWNHGDHDFKCEEGKSARLTRQLPLYEEVCV